LEVSISKKTASVAAIVWSLLGCAVARADGIDLVPYLTRVNGEHSIAALVGLITTMMMVNYLLNLLVIGWPSIRLAGVPFGRAAKGLVGFTFLAQVADRIGALCAGFLAGPLAAFFMPEGEGAWVIPLLVLNFLLSGLAVAALTLYLVGRRWRVTGGTKWGIVLSAAVLTNPAWALGLCFLR